MLWVQRTVRLAPRRRGLHLITDEVIDAVPELASVTVGLLHVFCRHTSAALTLNENASPDVRVDLGRWLDRAVPEDAPWTHVYEGPDDMPAHVKTALLGPDLTIPVTDGGLALGTWQGIMLAEHRDRAGARSLVLTLSGRDD
ncbi:MAG: YjbQ family protein [Patulibacter sp.]|nr:YjbQ family protein [Patulibacter sp.]